MQTTATKMPDPTELRFNSGDAYCTVTLYKPQGPAPHPVIIMGHGLGAIRQMRLPAYAERFVAAGYACLVFDYRHFGDSGGEPRQLLDIQRQLQDWKAAVAFARSRPELDPARIVVWGTSFGGGHVMVTAAEDAGIAAMIAQCPFTDGLASGVVMNPWSASKVMALAVRDKIGSLMGRAPLLVTSAGPRFSTALMTAPDCEQGYLQLVPDGIAFQNRVAARFALQVITHVPGERTPDIRCPALFCICDGDSVAPAKASLRHARKAQGRDQAVSRRAFRYLRGRRLRARGAGPDRVFAAARAR